MGRPISTVNAWITSLNERPFSYPSCWNHSHCLLLSKIYLTNNNDLKGQPISTVTVGIEYKLLSLTYKVLTTSQPDYLHNLISVHSTCRTRSSSTVTLARPSVSSSLQITNRSFRYASPYLWNQLPSSFRQPHSVHPPPGSPHPVHITSSQSPPSLSPSITPSVFHSRLKTHLFHKSFPP